MKTALLLAAGLSLVALPAQAVSDGPATVTLPQCAQDGPVSNVRVPDCSYLALANRDGSIIYAYLSAAGPVSWQGTSNAGTLTFPSTRQNWPTVSLFGNIATARLFPQTITGTVNDAGDVSLTVAFTVRVNALGQSCTATGSMTASSSGTDSLGGGTGSPRTPTGQFAIAGYTPTGPTVSGDACARANDYIDFSKGLGVYSTGLLMLDSGGSGGAAGAQTATVNTPKKLKRKGTTVILPSAVTTNAGQKAVASLTWSPKKSANGSNPRFARAKVTKSGKVALRTTGVAKRLHVRLTLSAPPADGYQEYLVTKSWLVR